MNYVYYIVNKNTMTILSAEANFVEAYNKAQEMNEPCVIFQGCFLTETAGSSMTSEQQFEQMPENEEI